MTKENGNKLDAKSAKAGKERSQKRSHKKEKQKPQTKIIIRHLPPTMTEEEFLKQIDPLPSYDFYYYSAADWSLGYDATCRAYITMKNYDDVFLFRDRFDGYVFVDSKGAEYAAIVEFAPFQGLVKNKSRRSDNKVNTIEQEQHYQQFLSKLEEDREAAKGGECKLEFSLDRKKEEKITSTPLLQYLANKKEKRREEAKRRQEEKRRQREEEKDRRKQAQSQVTKIISNQDSAGGGSKGGNKSACGKENVGDKMIQQQSQEEGKSSRSQRRAERNQRRREEFERRRQEREQRDKGNDGKVKMEIDGEPSSGVEKKNKKEKESQQPSNKSDDGKQQLRKEGGKRYSERRERDRNRNRRDKEKEKEKQKEDSASDFTGTVESTASETITAAAAVAAAGGEAVVSESVLNFIRSVATAKEFVPKHKQQELEDLQKKTSPDDKKEEKEKKAADSKISSDEQKKSDSTVEEDGRIQKQRTADEQRRIRNKDRPSIAIYQPKTRLRISEERDPSASQLQSSGKSDTRSNPNSDCESVKKEETGGKKVSRYSERRAERRNNRERQKAVPENANAGQKKDGIDIIDEPMFNANENSSPIDIGNINENELDKHVEN